MWVPTFRTLCITIVFLLQFIVYGGFWIAISILFVGLFVIGNFFTSSGLADFKQKIRDEGIILNGTNDPNPTLRKGRVTDDERRDVPVGTIEAQ